MNNSDKARLAIIDKIEKIESIRNPEQFDQWKNATIGTLSRAVPSDLTIADQISSIRAIGNYGGDVTATAKGMAKELLTSFLEDVERFGLSVSQPKEVDSSKGPIIVNYQSTEVNVEVSFVVDALSSELSEAQLSELRLALNSVNSAEEKKSAFLEKIKSFGSDVASNVLASILVNPQVYNHLLKMVSN